VVARSGPTTQGSISAVTSARWRAPSRGDERALILSPLPRAAPLWRAVLVTGVADAGLALVLVLHYALADGVGGLAVLASLIDAPANPAEFCFPRPAPTYAR